MADRLGRKRVLVEDVEIAQSTKVGGQDLVSVIDGESIGLLGDILKELKKINLHLSFMTDMTIKNTEVE